MAHFETPKYYESYCDFKYDESFLKIKNLQYMPWIGLDFSQQNPKILVIAESIYNYNVNIDKERETEILRQLNHKYQARAIVKEHGLDFLSSIHGVSDKKNSPIKNFGKIFYNKKNLTNHEKLAIWKKVAFHEFIQTPLKHRKDRQVVNNENVQIGFQIICELIKILEPHYIIFSGVSCIGYLNDNPKISVKQIEVGEIVNPRQGEIRVEGNSFPYIALKHFSYFSYSFHNIIKEDFHRYYNQEIFV